MLFINNATLRVFRGYECTPECGFAITNIKSLLVTNMSIFSSILSFIV